MRLSSADQHSLHSEGLRAVLVRSTLNNPQPINMKFFVFFFLCCVAMAAAAPQFITSWPGYVAPAFGSRTVVAGPTVVNGFDGFNRFVSPGYVGVY